MKNLKLFLFFALAVLLFLPGAAQAQNRISGRAVEIIDGKTVVIEISNVARMAVELQYVEVPEAGQPLYQTAKEHLRALVEGKTVEFRARSMAQAKVVGQLVSNGVDISQQMIRDGAAWYAVLEKNGQDAEQSGVYQSNEAQARAERRGVWSIENLKPSWQIRAEAERENLAREINRQAAEQTTVSRGGNRGNAARRPLTNNNFQMWADVSGYAAGNRAAGGAGNLEIKYDASAKTGYVATTQAVQNLTGAKSSEQKIDLRVAYLYRDSASRGRESIYLVGIFSEADNWKFLKSNSLTVDADGQKIVVGVARRLYRRNGYAAQELLLYKISRSSIMKIAGARKLEVKLGLYSGALSENLQAMLKNLLQASA